MRRIACAGVVVMMAAVVGAVALGGGGDAAPARAAIARAPAASRVPGSQVPGLYGSACYVSIPYCSQRPCTEFVQGAPGRACAPAVTTGRAVSKGRRTPSSSGGIVQLYTPLMATLRPLSRELAARLAARHRP